MPKEKPAITKALASEIKRRQRLLAEMEELFAGAEECGVDCAERRELRDYLQGQYQMVLKNFAP